ncbi:hypothetical protein PLANTIT3_90092 [Plantibacter sp. T3]|nr:hypothetical protein PLANTIT3_90092 [Plantibacter sp. T3]
MASGLPGVPPGVGPVHCIAAVIDGGSLDPPSYDGLCAGRVRLRGRVRATDAYTRRMGFFRRKSQQPPTPLAATEPTVGGPDGPDDLDDLDERGWDAVTQAVSQHYPGAREFHVAYSPGRASRSRPRGARRAFVSWRVVFSRHGLRA